VLCPSVNRIITLAFFSVSRRFEEVIIAPPISVPPTLLILILPIAVSAFFSSSVKSCSTKLVPAKETTPIFVLA